MKASNRNERNGPPLSVTIVTSGSTPPSASREVQAIAAAWVRAADSRPLGVTSGWPAWVSSHDAWVGSAANDYGVAAGQGRRQIAGCLLR